MCKILTRRLTICKIFVKQTSPSDDRVHGFVCLLIFRAGLTRSFFLPKLRVIKTDDKFIEKAGCVTEISV
ncbi:MAG: hypothetical protein A2W80_07275 [Candidatus Riflebacteria bacterium GWC2_50_8]|nr:MAG: hypothetical protein A2W80_07275 [Candidatus Riflebacteria bacterium GWC2_50_8]